MTGENPASIIETSGRLSIFQICFDTFSLRDAEYGRSQEVAEKGHKTIISFQRDTETKISASDILRGEQESNLVKGCSCKYLSCVFTGLREDR